MAINVILILISSVFAQQYTTPAVKQSKVDERVNEHMQKTNKKIEIQGLKKEVELKRNAPINLQPIATPKKHVPFIVNPKKEVQDPAVLKDQYDHSNGSDPSVEFEQQIIKTRAAPSEEATNLEYIRQFKENAAKAGVKVEIDPKTLEVRPSK